MAAELVAHRLHHRPASLTRVLHVAADGGQLVVTGKGPLRQLVQPRAHYAAVVPQLGDLAQLELEILRGVQDLVALGVRLEHAVLNPIVDHLDVVTGTGRTDVRVAIWRRQLPKQRLAMLERGGRAPNHETVAELEAP